MPRSEEYYPYLDRTLGLLQRQGEIQREQSRYGAEDIANTRREIGYTMGKAISDLPERYQQGKKSRQDFETGQHQGELTRQRADQTRMETEEARAKQKWLDEEESPGVTRRTASYKQDMENQRLMNQERAASIADSRQRMNMLSEEQQWKRGDRQVEELATLMQGQLGQTPNIDYSASRASLRKVGYNDNEIDQMIQQKQAQGNAEGVAALRQEGRNRGMTEAQIDKAILMAKGSISSGRKADQLLYRESPEGARAVEEVDRLYKDVSEMAKLRDAVNIYKNSYRGTEKATFAKQEAIAAAEKLGVQNAGAVIEDAILREQSMDTVIGFAKNQVEERLQMLERTAGISGTPEIKRQISQLKIALQELGGAGASTGSVNIFSGQKAPSAQTQLQSILTGQQNQPPPPPMGQYGVGFGGGGSMPPPQQGPAVSFQPGALPPQQGQPQAAPAPQGPVSPYRQNMKR